MRGSANTARIPRLLQGNILILSGLPYTAEWGHAHSVEKTLDLSPLKQYNINIMMNKTHKGPKPGTPSPLRGRPSPLKGRQWPSRWITGTDPHVRIMRRKWLLAKNQAAHRHQEWSITWPQYQQLIAQTQGNWGRRRGAVNLARLDHRLGWHSHNVTLKDRSSVMHRASLKAHGKDSNK